LEILGDNCKHGGFRLPAKVLDNIQVAVACSPTKTVEVKRGPRELHQEQQVTNEGHCRPLRLGALHPLLHPKAIAQSWYDLKITKAGRMTKCKSVPKEKAQPTTDLGNGRGSFWTPQAMNSHYAQMEERKQVVLKLTVSAA
jgi:hypothetical protein